MGDRGGFYSPVRDYSEFLEDRILPASLLWVGDVSTQWADQQDSDTNWSNNLLPEDGDKLLFNGTVTGTLVNNSTSGNSYSMSFDSGNNTVTGHSIALDNHGTDIIQISGRNLLATPLELGRGYRKTVCKFPLVLSGFQEEAFQK